MHFERWFLDAAAGVMCLDNTTLRLPFVDTNWQRLSDMSPNLHPCIHPSMIGMEVCGAAMVTQLE